MHAGGFGGFHGGGFSGGFHHGGYGGFHHHHGFGPGFAIGLGIGYPYYGYDGYYPYYGYRDDDAGTGCYIVHHRVHTRHGWRYRSEQVCE